MAQPKKKDNGVILRKGSLHKYDLSHYLNYLDQLMRNDIMYSLNNQPDELMFLYLNAHKNLALYDNRND